MNKKCERCLKTVYPLEELKCFDKIWHKSCFRCTECGMLLTLKNYRGHNRMPYCSAHMPKLQATPIASTAELRRLTNNTRIQSDRKYHEDYERGKVRSNKGSDEAETVRSKQSTKIHSNVAYRICKFEHKNIVEQRKRELDELLLKSSSKRSSLNSSYSSSGRPSLVNLYQAKTRTHKLLPNSDSCHSNYSTFSESSKSSLKFTNRPYKTNKFSKKLSNSNNSTDSSVVTIDSERSISKDKAKMTRLNAGNTPEKLQEIFLRRGRKGDSLSVSSMSFEFNRLNNGSELNNLDNFDVDDGSTITLTTKRSRLLQQTVSKWKQEEKLEEVTDFVDPKPIKESTDEQVEVELIEPSTSSRKTTEVERKSSNSNVPTYRAAFAFEAKETDEVSFREGDTIFEVERENSGWIVGRVERTGKIGLLPITYVARFKGNSQAQTEKTDHKSIKL